MKILSPDLVRGRQPKPIFPSFPLRDVVFAARRPSDEQSSYRAIVRPSGPSLKWQKRVGDGNINNVVKADLSGDTMERCAQVWTIESSRTDAADCTT